MCSQLFLRREGKRTIFNLTVERDRKRGRGVMNFSVILELRRKLERLITALKLTHIRMCERHTSVSTFMPPQLELFRKRFLAAFKIASKRFLTVMYKPCVSLQVLLQKKRYGATFNFACILSLSTVNKLVPL